MSTHARHKSSLSNQNSDYDEETREEGHSGFISEDDHQSVHSSDDGMDSYAAYDTYRDTAWSPSPHYQSEDQECFGRYDNAEPWDDADSERYYNGWAQPPGAKAVE